MLRGMEQAEALANTSGYDFLLAQRGAEARDVRDAGRGACGQVGRRDPAAAQPSLDAAAVGLSHLIGAVELLAARVGHARRALAIAQKLMRELSTS